MRSHFLWVVILLSFIHSCSLIAGTISLKNDAPGKIEVEVRYYLCKSDTITIGWTEKKEINTKACCIRDITIKGRASE